MMTQNSTTAAFGTALQSNNGNRRTSFDPFAELLSAQGSRPHDLQPVNLRSVTPFQRALVSIDGTVTELYEE